MKIFKQLFILLAISFSIIPESSVSAESTPFSDDVIRQERIRKKIKGIRNNIFNSDREIAERLGVSPSTLCRFLKGKASPKIVKKFKGLVDGLGNSEIRSQSLIRYFLNKQLGGDSVKIRSTATRLELNSRTLRSFLSGEWSKKVLRKFKSTYPAVHDWLHTDFSSVYGYHLTPEENLSSIKEKGLDPDNKSMTGFSNSGSAADMKAMGQRAKQKVFLTSRYGNILRYQSQFHKKKLVVLRCCLGDFSDMADDPDDPGSFYVTQLVPPQNLEVLTFSKNSLGRNEIFWDEEAQWEGILNQNADAMYFGMGTGLWFFTSEFPDYKGLI